MVDSEEALKIVKNVLSKMYPSEGLSKLPDDTYNNFERLWNKFFNEL